MTEIDSSKLQAFKQKLQCLITNHNEDNTAHGDIRTAVAGKANSADLATVATSGDYEDLDNIPVIPEDVSDLTDLQNTPFTPKSHSHVLADLTNFTTVEVVVTYTDGTTETRQLVQYGQTVQGGGGNEYDTPL